MNGKTVLITGGAKGIGRAIALKFAKEGANIALNYRSEEPGGLIAEIRAENVKCLPLRADISNFSEAEGLVKSVISEFGKVDVLINNAGVTRDNLLLRMTEAEFDDVINTNLKGAFNMVKHTCAIMLKQRSGAIINISSVVGLIGNAGQANYAASKAGVIGLTKSAAKELASRGITVNAIAPGFIETSMTDGLTDEIKSKYIETIPLKRFGTADEIADGAFFLANASYITGQTLSINGGMVM